MSSPENPVEEPSEPLGSWRPPSDQPNTGSETPISPDETYAEPSHQGEEQAPSAPEAVTPEKRKGFLGRIASRRIDKHVHHHSGKIHSNAEQALNAPHWDPLDGYVAEPKQNKVSYSRSQRDASATQALLLASELSTTRPDKRFTRLSDRLLTPKAERKQGEHKTIGKEAHKVGRAAAQRMFGVGHMEAQVGYADMMSVGAENMQYIHDDAEAEAAQKHWGAILDPRNVLALRTQIIEDVVEQGVRRREIVSRIQSTGLNGLPVNYVAEYLGISVKQWLSIKSGTPNFGPETEDAGELRGLLTKLDTMVSLPQLALDKLVDLWHTSDGENNVAPLDTSPIERINGMRADMVSRRDSLDEQVIKAREAVQPYAYNPHDFMSRGGKKQGKHGKDHHDKESGEPQISAEDARILLALDAEVEDAIHEEAQTWDSTLPKEEKQRRQNQIRASVYRSHFGQDMSDTEIQQVFATIKQLSAERARRRPGN